MVTRQTFSLFFYHNIFFHEYNDRNKGGVCIFIYQLKGNDRSFYLSHDVYFPNDTFLSHLRQSLNFLEKNHPKRLLFLTDDRSSSFPFEQLAETLCSQFGYHPLLIDTTIEIQTFESFNEPSCYFFESVNSSSLNDKKIYNHERQFHFNLKSEKPLSTYEIDDLFEEMSSWFVTEKNKVLT